ncbi:Ornithine decarboxylase [Lithohypha guttulata]|uniref:Ornithine decarboxylase n=1 Tax=Lithohypha guttulata TaxID=1690604 RepID=UPI00315C5785
MVMAPSSILLHSEDTIIENYDRINSGTDSNYGAGKPFVSSNGELAKIMIKKVLHEQIARIDTDTCDPDEENAFYVADLGEVYRQHIRWKSNLPRVKPFYAVKCNPDTEVLRLLSKLGTGFDCASKAEIDIVLGLGVDPSRIIYAQPCKTKSYLRHAAQAGVARMTFDNADELYKIKNSFPDAEIVLRILTDDSASLCRLSTKFGADLDTAADLLRLAKQLNLNVTGVSFHVGSGAADPSAFAKAVKDARWVFDQADALDYKLSLLDVGGGFTDDTFEIFASRLNEALEEYFPPHIQVIAEPGRYYTANAFTLATNIIARRDVSSGPGTPTSTASTTSNASTPSTTTEKSYMLYLNDVPQVLYSSQARDLNKLIEYSIWGPTCDGIDVISESCYLPGTLDIGDWLYFENMGAYTKCSATRFNGFTDKHETMYVSSEAGASALLGY